MADGSINLQLILKGCRQGNRNAQRKLYEHFYGYALNLCLRYSKNREEAVEILNDAFFKALTRIDQYRPTSPFKPWLRGILLHAAIDYHRSAKRWHEAFEFPEEMPEARDETPFPHLAADDDVLPLVQRLPPAYRLVFNLYVMEGYSHQEIAAELGISPGTSRSNLVRAKEKLREWWLAENRHQAKTN